MSPRRAAREVRGDVPAPVARRRIAGRGWVAVTLLAWLTGCPANPDRSPPSSSSAKPAAVPEASATLTPPAPITTHLDATLAAVLRAAQERVLTEPKSADAWGRYGQALEAAEFPDEARRCYAQAVTLDPSAPGWLHLRGLAELATSPELALEHLRRAAAVPGPHQEASRLRLAQALFERGRIAEAAQPLQALLISRPDHPAARLELGRARLAEGQLGEANRWLEPCLTNPYTAQPATLLLSQIRAREGQGEAALALARRAQSMPRPFDWPDPLQKEVQALRSDRARFAEKIAQLLAQKRFAEAEVQLKDLLARTPEDPEALLLAGRAELLQRRCREAEARFRNHLRVAGDSVNGEIQLGLTLLCQERWADAATVLERAVALKPDFGQAHANLALARSRLGDGPGAIRSYRDALRCTPGDAATHAALAEELFRVGDVTAAREHVDRALQLDPANPRARTLRAREK